ncbi:MAG: DUF4366 domain-containing protein [Clostridiales bacterium]|nr:DUF4366 domain-containing protein [Clostridiales bacterium]
MKKTKIRIFTAILMSVICMTAFSTTAFAGGGEDTTEPTPEVTETPTPIAPLTPEGNLTLVDDVERIDKTDKQFITAVSKNGNYFYLVIDRAGKEDNVYLLNMVDEADLLAIMEDAPTEPKVCSCKDKCELGAVNADCPVCNTDRTGCTGKALEKEEPAEPQPEKEKGNPMGIMALLLVIGLVGGGVFYYFKVVKNKAKPQSNPNMNEYDYSDDDEDEYEYEPTSEEQEDTPEESEGEEK